VQYKPITKAGKCSDCHKYAVRFAYHHLCTPCSNKKEVCPKCMKHKDIWGLDEAAATELAEELDYLRETKGQIPGLPERERRALIRSLEKEAAGETSEAAEGEGAEGEVEAEGEEGEEGVEEEGEEGADDEDEEEETEARPAKAGAGATKPSRRPPAPADDEDEEGEDEDDGGPVDDSFKAAMKESDNVNSILTKALADARRKTEKM
jgi:Uncharacterized conserved protein (DUF2039)